ncbi:response regulator [Cohnella suwonensis]|uniref:Response regulator n=1 Tax=Cohnella suwonensis TaxID=696072 RepID=A0ABW0LVZ1_9BACL
MYTVLVVDDEAIVCQGIKEFLESSDINVTKVLTAWNGYEALDYLRMESVDLVLTDIQMDGLNGIELMESILAEKPDIPVVVISAHDEFHYAQMCIRLGARDYLIKPVLLTQLTEVVSRELSDRKEKYKLLLEDSLKLKFSMTGMSSLRTHFLNEVLTGSLEHDDECRYIFEHLGVELSGPYFAVYVVELLWSHAGLWGETIRSLRDRNLLKYAAFNIIEETLTDWNTLAFYGQGNRIMVILQLGDSEDERNRMDGLTKLNLIGNTLASNIRHYLHMEAVIGISSIRNGLEGLPDGYREANDAAKWHGLYGNHNVFYAADFSLKKLRAAVNWQEKTDTFVEWIKIGKKQEDVQESVSKFITDISPALEGEDSTAGIPLSIAYRVYATLLDMKETVGDRYKALDPLLFFQFPLSGMEQKKRLSAFLSEAAGLVHTSMTDQDQAIIQMTIQFIRIHYRSKGLKIQNVAEHVHLSPNYLSYLFKQIIGETIWEFVTKIRMEEAKQLLVNTTKKRYEIADEIGYESPEHFSRMFKRYFGESPNTIRG